MLSNCNLKLKIAEIVKATTKFKITGWEEEKITDLSKGGKLTRAHVGKSYEGDLEGEGMVEYLMTYRPDGSADFVGYEKFEGSLKGQNGSFVFEHRGFFRDGEANDTWKVVKDSGSDALSGLSGSVNFSEGHKEEYEITFDYEL